MVEFWVSNAFDLARTQRHTRMPLSHRVGFFNQVNLESHVESVVFRIPLDGNHGDEVHERLAALAIVDDTGLDLAAVCDGRP